MSAALSLLEEDPFDEPRLTVVPDPTPTTPRSVAAPPVPPARTAGSGWHPLAVVPALVLATLVASPALYQGLVRHQITVGTMLERWGLVALGCCLIGEGVRRYVQRIEADRAVEPDPVVDSLDDSPEAALPPDEVDVEALLGLE